MKNTHSEAQNKTKDVDSISFTDEQTKWMNELDSWNVLKILHQ